MIHFSQHRCIIPSADYSISHAFILGYFDHEIFAVAKGACISRFPHTQRTHGLWVEWNAASHSIFFFPQQKQQIFTRNLGPAAFIPPWFLWQFPKKKKNQIQNLQINPLILQRTYHCHCTRVFVHEYGCYLCICMYVYVH